MYFYQCNQAVFIAKSMRIFFKYFVVLISVFVLGQVPYALVAQTSQKGVDSLYAEYVKCSIDSDKVNILIQLSIRTGCRDSTKKLGFITKAFGLAEKLKWDKGRLICNKVLGDYLSSCGNDYGRAISCYQNSAYLAETLKDTMNLVVALEKIAGNYENLAQHNQSLDYHNRALSLNPDPGVSMGILGNMGVIYCGIGDYSQALIYYNRVLGLLDNIVYSKKGGDKQDTATRGVLLLNIGDIYVAMLQPDKALENYEFVYRLSVATHDQYLLLMSQMAEGKAYFIKKDHNSAIKKFELALVNARDLGQPYYEAIILNQLAKAFIAIGDVGRANEYAVAALRISEKGNFVAQFPETYMTMSKLLAMQNDNQGAIGYLQKALEFCQKVHALEDEKSAWEALSNIYDKTNQPGKALAAYRHFISLRDSLYNIDKANELVRIDLQAGFGRKQLADSLKQVKQSRAYELKMQRQQGITYSMLIGSALVLLLSFFVYRNYNTQKKYNELLSKEKASHLAYIEAQSNALTDFAHIQSHDIRGPVSTLLGLVKVFNFDDPNDPDNKEVIEGIAIVTERLDKIVTDVVSQENKFSTKGKFK